MEILIAILIATAIAHGGTQRGRDAVRDGFHSVRNAARALRGRGGPGAKDRLLNDYRDGRASLSDRPHQTPAAETRPDAAGVSKGRLLGTAAWRGYKGGWTGDTARRRAADADQTVAGPDQTSSEEEGNDMNNGPISSRIISGSPAMEGLSPEVERGFSRAPASLASKVLDGTHSGGGPASRGGGHIATATGGEILSYPQLLAELDAIVAEAAAEVEDRLAAKQRAADDVARIDLMLASLSRLELDRESLGKLQAIGETNDLKMRLAGQSADNAEHRHALAVDAKATVVRKHQMLQEAHAAAGRDAAAKQFYQAG